MPFNVTMPDGTIVQNVPDGTTKEQFMSKYQANVPDMPHLQPATTQQPQVQTKAPEQPGIIGRAANEMSAINPNQNPMSVGIQGAGVLGRAATAAGGEVAKAGAEALKSAAPSVYNTMASGLNYAGEKIGQGVQAAQEATKNFPTNPLLEKQRQAGAEFGQQHPEAMANVRGLIDSASLVPTSKVLDAGLKVAGEVSAVRPVLKGIMSPSAEAFEGRTKILHDKATKTIEAVKDAGVAYSPQHGDDLLKATDKVNQLRTAGERAGEPKTVAMLDNMRKSIESGDTTLRNLYGFSKAFGEIGQSGETAALSVKKLVDKAIMEGTPVSGDPNILKKIPEFKQQWGVAKQHETIVNALKNFGDEPKKLRNEMQKVVDSKYFNSLDPQVQSAAKLAASGKLTGKTLDAIGGLRKIFGVSILGKHAPLLEAGAAIASGHPAIAGGIGAVMGAGAAGAQVQKGLVADILRQLEKN